MEGEEVWVAHGHKGHGEEARVAGVYESREAAFERLKDLPNMTVYVDERGDVIGYPKNDRTWDRLWVIAQPMKVQGRKPAPTPAQ